MGLNGKWYIMLTIPVHIGHLQFMPFIHRRRKYKLNYLRVLVGRKFCSTPAFGTQLQINICKCNLFGIVVELLLLTKLTVKRLSNDDEIFK